MTMQHGGEHLNIGTGNRLLGVGELKDGRLAIGAHCHHFVMLRPVVVRIDGLDEGLASVCDHVLKKVADDLEAMGLARKAAEADVATYVHYRRCKSMHNRREQGRKQGKGGLS